MSLIPLSTIAPFSSWENPFLDTDSPVNQRELSNRIKTAPLYSNKPWEITWQMVCTTYIAKFDVENLSLALEVFAKKCLLYRGTMDVILTNHSAILHNIQDHLLLQMEHCQPTTLGSICDALRLLKIKSAKILASIDTEVHKKIKNCTAVDLLLITNAFDVFDMLDEELLDVLIEQTYEICDQFSADQLCMIAQIFVDYYDTEIILTKLGEEAASRITSFTPRNLINFSITYATFNKRPNKIFRKIYTEALRKIDAFSAYQLVQFTDVWDQLEIPYDNAFLKQISEKSCAGTRGLTLDLRVKIVKIFSRAKYKDPKMFQNLRLIFSRLVDNLYPKHISLIIWGYGTQEIENTDLLLEKLSPRILKIEHKTWRQNELGTTAYGLAKAGYLDDRVFAYISSAITASKLSTFTTLHLYTIVCAYAHLQIEDFSLFEKLALRIIVLRKTFLPLHFTHIIACYTSLGYNNMLCEVQQAHFDDR